MKYLHTLLAFMALPALIALSGCEKEEQLDLTASIYYKYSIDAQILEYFDITMTFTGSEGTETVSPQYTVDENGRRVGVFSAYAYTDEIPGRTAFTFNVTRKSGRVPVESVEWQTNVDITVDVNFPDGSIKTSKTNQNSTYIVAPDQFEAWAESFILRMEVGQELYIIYDGNVNFSTE